jgi:hypothetical protein
MSHIYAAPPGIQKLSPEVLGCVFENLRGLEGARNLLPALRVSKEWKVGVMVWTKRKD